MGASYGAWSLAHITNMLVNEQEGVDGWENVCDMHMLREAWILSIP